MVTIKKDELERALGIYYDAKKICEAVSLTAVDHRQRFVSGVVVAAAGAAGRAVQVLTVTKSFLVAD